MLKTPFTASGGRVYRGNCVVPDDLCHQYRLGFYRSMTTLDGWQARIAKELHTSLTTAMAEALNQRDEHVHA